MSKYLIDERGSGGQLTNEEHNNNSNESDGDAYLVGSSALLAIAGRMSHEKT